MNLLAIETSSSACSLALLCDGQITSFHEIAPMQQAKLILPTIQTLFAERSISGDQLDGIAYGCGPGSFTGVRVACSVAQGLGFAFNKPIIQVSSLAVMAQTAFNERGLNKLLVAVDARMKQVYWATYEMDTVGNVQLLGEEKVCLPEDLSPPDGSTGWHGIGDGWSKYEEVMSLRIGFKPGLENPIVIPTASALLKLAMIKYRTREWVTAEEATPVYLS